MSECQDCGMSFFAEDALKLHMQLHEEKQYHCHICDMKYETSQFLDRHMNKHTGDVSFYCEECGKYFSGGGALKKHKMLHHDIVVNEKNLYQCHICDKKYTAKRSLNKHVNTHTGDVSFYCEECRTYFSNGGALKKHKMSQHGTATQINCELTFHSALKPFCCKECDHRFARSFELKKHMAIHTGENIFVCDICHKTFAYMRSLTAHTRLHSVEKHYKCKLCQKEFKRLSYVKMHMRTHTGETPIKPKPYVCHECSKSFTHATDLLQHMNVHTGVRPYKCHQCDKVFSTKDSLYTHKRKHSKEKLTVIKQQGSVSPSGANTLTDQGDTLTCAINTIDASETAFNNIESNLIQFESQFEGIKAESELYLGNTENQIKDETSN